MVGSKKPDEPGENMSDRSHGKKAEDGDELGSRSRALDEALAARRPAPASDERGGPPTGGAAGFGQAIKLSSEFIAGVAVGAGLGWLIDNLAGTSPWGLIVFLLVGFAAGVLNVLRSVGVVAEPERRVHPSQTGQKKDD